MTGSEPPRSAPADDTPPFELGPGFLDEEGLADQVKRIAPPPSTAGPGHSQGVKLGAGPDRLLPPLPSLGPMLLEPEQGAPARVDIGWSPKTVVAPRVRVGAGGWISAGLAVLLASWVVLSLASFVVGLLAQSWVLGSLAIAAVAVGCALLARGVALELGAYRALNQVEALRLVLALGSTPPEAARQAGLAWLRRVGSAVPDGGAVERMLGAAVTVAEIKAVLRSQVADRLQEAAARLGRQAAVDGAALVAVCPHPAWDGLLAGLRGLHVVRQVAALYGLRPSALVTVALLRRVAWMAAGTAGLSLVSQNVAEQVLGSMPVLKHVAGAIPGSGTAAIRLYRLAGVAAKACSPLD